MLLESEKFEEQGEKTNECLESAVSPEWPTAIACSKSLRKEPTKEISPTLATA